MPAAEVNKDNSDMEINNPNYLPALRSARLDARAWKASYSGLTPFNIPATCPLAIDMDLTQRTRSNLSELEDLSDSDWLDIASSRASEDEDSAAGFDSDREDAEGRPYSRHSFSSLASSSDEVVEGWEGLIEDGADETPLPVADPLADFALTPADRLPRDTASSPVEEEEDPEDERVKAALDQSMMSTLSSSRSNSLSNSLQTSIVHSTRSLRLSFPDPTTSRLESLSASFEELSSSDVGPLPESASPDEDPAADPVRPPTPEVAVSEEPPVEEREIAALALPSKPMFSVFLYGSSLASKMAFVDVLLQKWAIGSGFASRRKLYCESRTVVYAFKGLNNDDSIEHFVSVVDKTGTENVGLLLLPLVALNSSHFSLIRTPLRTALHSPFYFCLLSLRSAYPSTPYIFLS